MRFSILLPTRDRLEFLEQAAESVLVQDHGDWEIVISDNASTEDVGGYVARLGDGRVKYARTPELVDVTSNWNAVWERAEGEYVIMLGDDDCLMRGALSCLDEQLRTHRSPDMIYMSALCLAYPGVLPDHPAGRLQSGYVSFLEDVDHPVLLAHETAVAAVRDAMAFRVRFGFNMQYCVVRHDFAASLPRPFFRSPYPDYYAMCRALCEANSILLCPYPLVTIGITPKSFGYFYFNGIETQGEDFLHPASLRVASEYDSPRAVPGSRHLTSWLVAMEALGRDCQRVGRRVPDYRRYRFLQLEHVYRTYLMRRLPPPFPLHAFWRAYPPGERAVYRTAVAISLLALRILPRQWHRTVLRRVRRLFSPLWPYPEYAAPTTPSPATDLRTVFRNVDPFRPLAEQRWEDAHTRSEGAR